MEPTINEAAQHVTLDDRTTKKLASLKGKAWFPEELLTLVEAVCRLQAATSAALNPEAALPEEAVCGELEHRQGAPLLARELFPVDVAGAEALFGKLLDVAESLPQLRTAALLLRDGMLRGEIRPAELFHAYALETAEPFAAWAEQAPDAPNLLPFLVYNSMVPWLEATGNALLAAHPLPDAWQHGHCPVCGSPVFIGRLSEPEASRNEGRDINKGGKRLHTCSYCRVTFRAKRLQCPFCLEENTDKLDYFTVDTEPGYQVHICRTCKSYIKIADFRDRLDRNSVPALDDLESLPLDMAAQNEDFHRVAPSEWGL